MAMVLPKLWANNSNVTLSATQQVLQKYKDLLKWNKNPSIMEFGYADGNNSQQSFVPLLPKDCKEFVACDRSKEMLEYAKKYNNSSVSRFVEMDIADENLEPEFKERFDHIFGFYVIHHVKHPSKAFKNIRSMLKPGGTMFLTFFERVPVDDMYHNLREHPKWGKYCHENYMSPYYYSKNPEEDYRRDLVSAGFNNFILNTVKCEYVYSSEEECDNLHTSVNTVLPKIPKDEIDEYLQCFLAEKYRGPLFNITYNEKSEPVVAINYNLFVLVATKT